MRRGFVPWGAFVGILAGASSLSLGVLGWAIGFGLLVDLLRLLNRVKLGSGGGGGGRRIERDRRGRWVHAPPIGGLKERMLAGVALFAGTVWLTLGLLMDAGPVLWLAETLGPAVPRALGPPAFAVEALERGSPRLRHEAAELLALVFALGWCAVVANGLSCVPGLRRAVRIDRARRTALSRWLRLGSIVLLGGVFAALLFWNSTHVDACSESGALVRCSGLFSVLMIACSFGCIGWALARGLPTLATMAGLFRGGSYRPRI